MSLHPHRHPLVDAHPYARRVDLRPAPMAVLWGHHQVDGQPVRLRHQQPRPGWAGYPSGWCAPDVAGALRRLHRAWEYRGHGPLRCNALGRDPEQDAEFRGNGVAAHLPGAWRDDLVGWHLSGRAIDVTLPAPGPDRDALVGELLEVCGPIGWTPIAGEDWHFEFRGPWTAIAKELGTRQGALAALLDVGGWRGPRWEWRAVQAQLWRVGHPCGKLDGNVGPLTTVALDALNLVGRTPDDILPRLYRRQA